MAESHCTAGRAGDRNDLRSLPEALRRVDIDREGGFQHSNFYFADLFGAVLGGGGRLHPHDNNFGLRDLPEPAVRPGRLHAADIRASADDHIGRGLALGPRLRPKEFHLQDRLRAPTQDKARLN